MSIGSRLREERERLQLSQEAMGKAGGVKKLAQINYEKDERTPTGNYLASVAEIGVDVGYVLTDRRTAPASSDAGAVEGLKSVRKALDQIINELSTKNT